MRKVAVLPREHVYELRCRLDEASIGSHETPEGVGGPNEWPNLTIAPAPESVSIWVEDTDIEIASEIAAGYLKELAASIAPTKCSQCGYDLRGHRLKGKCPECGHAFELPAEVKTVDCPACGEEVPGNFEVCWNCGAAIGG